MYIDDSIHLGYATTDSQILRFAEAPLLSVMAPLEINPQIIMWDPETYPDVETLADLGDAGVTINVFGGGTFSDVFVAQGIWTADQVDPSYDGSPGAVHRRGRHRPAGLRLGRALTSTRSSSRSTASAISPTSCCTTPASRCYSQTLGIRPDDLETLRPCLEQLIPIVQQATVDFSPIPAEHERHHRRRRRDVRHLLGLPRRARRLLGRDADRTRPRTATAPTTPSATWTKPASRQVIDAMRGGVDGLPGGPRRRRHRSPTSSSTSPSDSEPNDHVTWSPGVRVLRRRTPGSRPAFARLARS